MKKKLVVLGTGGTIAGTSARPGDTVGYRAGQVAVGQLLDSLPSSARLAITVDLEHEQVAQVDSKDMDWAIWQQVACRVLHYLEHPDVQAIVITHGTDTLEETAYFLSRVLPARLLANKPVVLTCAMRPATADFPDGPQNLRDALVAALARGAHGVLLVCAGEVHRGRQVQKLHPYRVNAFSSGDQGPLGYLEEGQVRWVRSVDQDGATSDVVACWQRPVEQWPRVEVVMNMVGAGGAAVRGLCAPSAVGDAPLQGLVVAGTGNGTLNRDLEVALDSARAQGVRVVVTSRCQSGQLVAGHSVSPDDPLYLGLPIVKARIALVLELLGIRD